MRRLSFACFVACCVTVGAGSPVLSQEYGYSFGNSTAPHRWEGFYAGAHVGGAWGSTEAKDAGGAVLDAPIFGRIANGVILSNTDFLIA